MRRVPDSSRALRLPLGVTLTAIALGVGQSHCSYDVVLHQTSTSALPQAGAAGQSSSGAAGQSSGGSSELGGSGATATASRPIDVLLFLSTSSSIPWQWQLQGNQDLSVAAFLHVVDLFDVTDADLAALRANGRVSICSFSAGTAESWRDDVGDLPAEVLGNRMSSGESETWLDVRAASVRQLMASRLARASTRGCTGVLPDSVDGYGADTGFPIGTAESLDYMSFLSSEAHRLGLAIGLSSSPKLVTSAEPMFDFVVQTSCLDYDECDAYRPFLDANKSVLEVEFVSDATDGAERLSTICGNSSREGFSTILKLRKLDAWRLSCD
jgi:hypothetical protein